MHTGKTTPFSCYRRKTAAQNLKWLKPTWHVACPGNNSKKVLAFPKLDGTFQKIKWDHGFTIMLHFGLRLHGTSAMYLDPMLLYHEIDNKKKQN